MKESVLRRIWFCVTCHLILNSNKGTQTMSWCQLHEVSRKTTDNTCILKKKNQFISNNNNKPCNNHNCKVKLTILVFLEYLNAFK